MRPFGPAAGFSASRCIVSSSATSRRLRPFESVIPRGVDITGGARTSIFRLNARCARVPRRENMPNYRHIIVSTLLNLFVERALFSRARRVVWWVLGAFEGWAGGSGDRRPGRAAGGCDAALVALSGVLSGGSFRPGTRQVPAILQAPLPLSERAAITGGFEDGLAASELVPPGCRLPSLVALRDNLLGQAQGLRSRSEGSRSEVVAERSRLAREARG